MAQHYLKPIPPRIVILGAGVAGSIYAERMLHRAKKEGRLKPDISILDRGAPGGRMATHMFTNEEGKKVAFDLYARWDHYPNPTDNEYNLFTHRTGKLMKARAAALQVAKRKLVMCDRLSAVYDVDENRNMKVSLRAPAFAALEETYNRLNIASARDDISLAELARLTGELWVEREVRTSHSYTWEGAPPEEISVRNGMRDPAVSGGIIYRNGIIEPFNLHFGKIQKKGAIFIPDYQVRKIVSHDYGCTISSANGRENIHADRAVVTFSIGVLQREIVDYMAPRVTQYIAGLKMGDMSKIAVLLSEDYLEREGIKHDERVYFTMGSGGPPDGMRGFIDQRPGKSPLLVLQFGGPYALWNEDNQHLARLTAERMLWHTPRFENCLNHIQAVHFAGTSRDERFFGAYSHTEIGWDRIGPVQAGAATWCGEAFTHPEKSPGTYGGAAASGAEAVDMDFDLLVEQGRLPFQPAKPKHYDMRVRVPAESVALYL